MIFQFQSFVSCVAGKNLYNNEHVAVKLVSFMFRFLSGFKTIN